ncbi:hypothetical protein EDC02_1357 [Micromonospora sp. Llam0]|nr:hypothetical protein EDC02_1357 [Micromonospora sp. Llam0]
MAVRGASTSAPRTGAALVDQLKQVGEIAVYPT